MATYSLLRFPTAKTTCRQEIALLGPRAWPFVTCRRFTPWRYSASLVYGRYPQLSLPVPPEIVRSMPTLVRTKLRPTLAKER